MNKKMLTRFITAFAILAVVIPTIMFGGILVQVMVFAFLGVGCFEIAKLNDSKDLILSVMAASFLAVTVASLLSSKYLVPIVAVYGVVLYVISLFDERVSIDSVTHSFFIVFVVIQGWRAINTIYSVGYNWKGFIFVGLACYMADTGAYLFGSFFGKHKMIPRVSPNKTWEGSIGGYVTACITSVLFGLFLTDIPKGLVISSALILPAIAEIGDLVFSSIKRKWGIKDYGNIFPGHGGVLDRVDSLLFVLLVFNVLMILFGVSL